MPLSITNFGAYLGNWAQNYANQFKLYYPLRGGWEAWTQASVAAYIFQDNNTIDLLREQMIFDGSQQKVDWLLNDSGRSVNTKVAIELKCQSFDNQKNFTGGLKADIAKLAQPNLKVAYRGCRTAVVGIAFTQDATGWMRISNFKTVYGSGEVFIGLSTVH